MHPGWLDDTHRVPPPLHFTWLLALSSAPHNSTAMRRRISCSPLTSDNALRTPVLCSLLALCAILAPHTLLLLTTPISSLVLDVGSGWRSVSMLSLPRPPTCRHQSAEPSDLSGWYGAEVCSKGLL
ncbi:hypothetical protein C8R47DRAFT_1223081 [Mycena vitilis]|nr:hypothetical protein C8R47DRAFT_1223081 [Mycena vitilis]